jgi:hypothetical protein
MIEELQISRRTDFTENALMRHVSIGFLPEGFHPLHRFLSLSNRQERPAANSIVCSKRVRSSGTAYRAKTVSSDSTALSEVINKQREWTVVVRRCRW